MDLQSEVIKMNNKFLTDYLVIFTNSQNDLLEVILNNKGYNKIPILKETSEIVSKLASCTYSILSVEIPLD